MLAVLWVLTALSVLGGVALAVARAGSQTTRNRILLVRAGWAREACGEILLARYAQNPAVRAVDSVDLGRGVWCRATLEDPKHPGRMKDAWTADGDHPSVEGYRRLGELAFRVP